MSRPASFVALVIGCLCVTQTVLAEDFEIVGQTTVTHPGDSGVLATQVSQLTLEPGFTSKDCIGWTAAWAKGLAATPTGALQQLDCVARPIACCVPVPEPSTSSGLVPGALLLCALQRWRVGGEL